MGKHGNEKRLNRHAPVNREANQESWRAYNERRGALVDLWYRERQQMAERERRFEERHPEAAAAMRRRLGRIPDDAADAALLRDIAERVDMMTGAMERIGPH